MARYVQAVILTRSQPITITTLNGLVCLKDKKQQQMANFAQLCNLLLLLYVFALSHFLFFFCISVADTQQLIEFL